MHLEFAMKRLQSQNKTYTSPRGTASRVCEIYDNDESNESGLKPVYITPENDAKKIKKRIN